MGLTLLSSLPRGSEGGVVDRETCTLVAVVALDSQVALCFVRPMLQLVVVFAPLRFWSVSNGDTANRCPALTAEMHTEGFRPPRHSHRPMRPRWPIISETTGSGLKAASPQSRIPETLMSYPSEFSISKKVLALSGLQNHSTDSNQSVKRS